MITMSLEEVEADFSEALKKVENGEKIGITMGESTMIKAFLVPNAENSKPRKLGILVGKGKAHFKDDFKMSDEELFDL